MLSTSVGGISSLTAHRILESVLLFSISLETWRGVVPCPGLYDSTCTLSWAHVQGGESLRSEVWLRYQGTEELSWGDMSHAALVSSSY